VKYLSTRGHAASEHFCDILLAGLAPDGGLYLPDHYPQVSRATLESWRALNYAELAAAVLGLFIDDMPAEDLRALCKRTYAAANYRYVRPGDDPASIAPLRWLEPGRLALLQLSNGPTLAFKDMAMQLLGNLFEYELARRSETLNILGATSGDTGSAAEYAMRGKQGIRVFMLSPHERMSAFQRAQMYSLTDPNIFNIAITGVFDDAQDLVKAVSHDVDFKRRYRIGTVNSINWARVAAQVVYYFWGYLRATGNSTESVAFCVPSGNFGNICAGHIARQMGLPIGRLLLATNENDVLDEFFRTGVYRPRPAVETRATSSPSMDISKASNFERFVFDLLDRSPEELQRRWQVVERGGVLDLRDTPYFATLDSFAFRSASSSHADRLATIRRVWADYGVMVDPHTADGLKVAGQLDAGDLPIVVLETALPVKFAEILIEALQRAPERPAGLGDIESLPQQLTVMAPELSALQRFIAAHATP